MSEKEKALAKKIAALPDVLQQRILDQASGAAMALDLIQGSGKEGDDGKRDDAHD